MFQLIMTVMAIALTALLVFGGMNYMNSDIGNHTRTVSSLHTHFDTLTMGVSSYRQLNHGHPPSSISKLTGFVPENIINVFPRGVNYLEWEINEGKYCLKRNSDFSMNFPRGVSTGVALFAVQKALSIKGKIEIGTDCNNMTTVIDMATVKATEIDTIQKTISDAFMAETDDNVVILVGTL